MFKSICASQRPTNSMFARLNCVTRSLGLAAFAITLLFASPVSLMAHEFSAGDLELVHPWSRETPPSASVAAGYVRITNNGSEADRLLAASGEIAERTEIHEMTVNDQGIMTMRPIHSLDIPAGGEVDLKPGGYHIMFLNLKDPKKEGDTFVGSLTFEKAGTVKVEFLVESMGKAAVDHSDHHHHDHDAEHGAHDGANGHGE